MPNSSDPVFPLTLKDLYELFPKKGTLAPTDRSLIDTRFESTFDVLRKSALSANTPSTFGVSDTVVGIVLRLDPRKSSDVSFLPNDDGQIAKVMVLDNYHTTLLPLPRSVDPLDKKSQTYIDVYPEFVYDRSLNGQIVTGTLVEGTFEAGSLKQGRIGAVLETSVQHLLESQLAGDMVKEKPELFAHDRSLKDLPSSKGPNKPKFKRIYIDYGHGGMLDGKYMMKAHEGKKYTFKNYNGVPPLSTRGAPNTLYEGEYNREVAWRLINMLVNMATTYYDRHESPMTGSLGIGWEAFTPDLARSQLEVHDVVAGKRITAPVSFNDLEQTNVDLSLRTAYANKNPDDALFISLHGNAAGTNEQLKKGDGSSARGVIIFTTDGEDESDEVANTVYEAFRSTSTGIPVKSASRKTYAGRKYSNRKEGTLNPTYGRTLQSSQTWKHDYEANFWVLRKSRMPSILGEVGFFTNLEDAQLMSNSAAQDMIALAYFKAIIQHLQSDRELATAESSAGGIGVETG